MGQFKLAPKGGKKRWHTIDPILIFLVRFQAAFLARRHVGFMQKDRLFFIAAGLPF
jgi:hypothetical protein